MITYHMIAFFLGFLMDMLFGDPYFLPHPIRLIGNLISRLEQWLRGKESGKDKKRELQKGRILVLLVLTISVSAVGFLLVFAYKLHPIAGCVMEAVMTYQILAAKCLKAESMKVYASLKDDDLMAARKAVSMIVGRDTEGLDETEVAKAAIETVAENTSDGVIAPMLYTALGGPILGFFYKAVNTMDSMVGYKNEKYLHFGRAAAKTDDFLNYIPARISAYLMILASFFAGKEFHGKKAFFIYKRDNRNHASPNSAQTEAACAGALGIKLAGEAVYFGKTVKKPYIGDAIRSVEYEDIKRTNHLMYLTAWICEGFCLVVMLTVHLIG